MQLDLDNPDGNRIRSCSPGCIQINDTVFEDHVIVTANAIDTGWSPPAVTAMDLDSFARVLAHEPELIVLGTGSEQRFPPPELMVGIMRRGIGLEVMNTSAACRTFNVLVAERRKVVGALLVG